MTKNISYMFNWVCIIAIAAAFFISRPTSHRGTESRVNLNSFSNKSSSLQDWEMNDPLMMLLAPDVWMGNGDNDIKMERDCTSVDKSTE
jgi:hypothetical protein